MSKKEKYNKEKYNKEKHNKEKHNKEKHNKEKHNKEDYGVLYVIGTPIGNLEDITYRAIRMLSEVDTILCEDTRRTIKLLNHYEIKKPLLSYHSYNEKRVVDKIVLSLKSGKNIALVTDGGTPGISDPGGLLVSNAVNNEIIVNPIPGPSACVTLLSVSGFPSHVFQFVGFLSIKKNKRLKKLADLQNYKGVIILYESPHRMLKLLDEMAEIFANCQIIIGRELTKKFEEIYRGKAKELADNKDQIKIKGEYTILINNYDEG